MKKFKVMQAKIKDPDEIIIIEDNDLPMGITADFIDGSLLFLFLRPVADEDNDDSDNSDNNKVEPVNPSVDSGIGVLTEIESKPPGVITMNVGSDNELTGSET